MTFSAHKAYAPFGSGAIVGKKDYLNEEECVEALLKRSKARFVNLPKRTVEFLVRHCNHDMRSLLKVMDKLENAQIEHTHELTIPFVKKILNLN